MTRRDKILLGIAAFAVVGLAWNALAPAPTKKPAVRNTVYGPETPREPKKPKAPERPAVQGPALIARESQERIPVWRSADALTEGLRLLRAKADSSLIVPLLACSAAHGTRVVEGADDPGMYLRSVIVVSGESKGCRGVVVVENFQRGQISN